MPSGSFSIPNDNIELFEASFFDERLGEAQGEGTGDIWRNDPGHSGYEGSRLLFLSFWIW